MLVMPQKYEKESKCNHTIVIFLAKNVRVCHFVILTCLARFSH